MSGEDIAAIVVATIMIPVSYWFVRFVVLDTVGHKQSAFKALDPFFFGYIRALMRKEPNYKVVINRKKKTISLKFKPTKFQILWFEYNSIYRSGIVNMTDIDIINDYGDRINEWVDELVEFHKEEIKVKTNSDITRVFDDVRKSKSL